MVVNVDDRHVTFIRFGPSPQVLPEMGPCLLPQRAVQPDLEDEFQGVDRRGDLERGRNDITDCRDNPLSRELHPLESFAGYLVLDSVHDPLYHETGKIVETPWPWFRH